jgi:hypothetical protein
MNADFDFHVADPEVAINPGGTMLVLRFQTAEPFQHGHKRSGKYIHLNMTTDFAMRLLAVLQQVKEMMALPDPPPLPPAILVPPVKDRN